MFDAIYHRYSSLLRPLHGRYQPWHRVTQTSDIASPGMVVLCPTKTLMLGLYCYLVLKSLDTNNYNRQRQLATEQNPILQLGLSRLFAKNCEKLGFVGFWCAIPDGIELLSLASKPFEMQICKVLS